jgi:mRNA-degrading endonuclease RelE of RelBE toxin-antitoxin system
MRHRITFSAEAKEDYDGLPAGIRAAVRDAINRHLQHQPTATSKSRIKRLRELQHPQYRLRVDEVRVFYDVVADEVKIIGIVEKRWTFDWLRQKGVPS